VKKHSPRRLKRRGTKSKSYSKTRSRKEKQGSKALVIDAPALSYAAFNTVGALSYNGYPTGVTFGFLRYVLGYAEKFKTKRFFFCWDAGVSHRHLVFPDYKKKRGNWYEDLTPEEKADREAMLLQRINLNHVILPYLGFHNTWVFKYWEADDLIAYWVKRLYKEGNEVILVSNDNDMFQLLNYCKIWNYKDKKFFTKKKFEKKFGIPPQDWAKVKAIGGCSSDEVPGIEGVSDPKSVKSNALKYHKGELTKGKVYDRITSKEGKKIIERNYNLVKLPYPGAKIPRMLLRRQQFSKFRFVRLFRENNFRSFLRKDQLKRWERAFDL
jgi:5'-3' exonuclease